MKRKGFLASAYAALIFGTAAIAPAPALADTVVTMNIVQVIGTIDPAKMSDYADYMAVVNLYDGLVNIDDTGKLVPELAESWEVSPDAREVTFRIRDDARFSDGSPVEASDVVYSVERLLRINQGPANLFSDILKPGAVTAVDDRTVRFALSKTFAPFLATMPAVMILNADLVKENEGSDDGQTYLATHAAGAGGYTLKSWDRGAQMTLARDRNYYKGFSEHPIDEVRWIVTNDESTVRALAASGELTMTSAFQAPDTYQALVAMGRFELITQDTATAFYLKLNTKIAPTDDIHIRRAIALATDYETIREVIRPGGVLSTPLPRAFAAFHADDILQPAFDLEAARAEVEKSKYAGSPIQLTFAYPTGGKVGEEIGLLMQSNLEQIGFKVTQQVEPWNRITDLATRVETTPNATEIYFGPTYPSPDSMFYTQYHSESAGTWASMEWLQNPEIDALIDKARATGDMEQQADIYRELQHRLVDLQPDVFLLTLTSQVAIDKCLSGYRYVPMQSFYYDFTRYSWTCNQD